jgi:hypothetical protein
VYSNTKSSVIFVFNTESYKDIVKRSGSKKNGVPGKAIFFTSRINVKSSNLTKDIKTQNKNKEING